MRVFASATCVSFSDSWCLISRLISPFLRSTRAVATSKPLPSASDHHVTSAGRRQPDSVPAAYVAAPENARLLSLPQLHVRSRPR